MTTKILGGPKTWAVRQDNESNREYKVTVQVLATSALDGPATVLQTKGLPDVGSLWIIGNDVDVYAWRRAETSCNPAISGEPNFLWNVEMTFSTKPDKRCQDTQVQDPLLEPQKLSGSFIRYTEQFRYDRFGNPIQTSAREPITGPLAEFDRNRMQVRVEQNVVDLQLPLISAMVDTVNQYVLWGMPPRTIKLSSISFERKYHGTCEVYFTRHLDFDVRYSTSGQDQYGFDRLIVDHGTMVLRGYWDRGPNSPTYGKWQTAPGVTGANYPADYVTFKDWDGNIPKSGVDLDGQGHPASQQHLTQSYILNEVQFNFDLNTGSGYTVGDVLTVVGPSGTPPTPAAQLTVATEDGGNVTGVFITNAGSYVQLPSNPVQVTGGSGTGAQFELSFLLVPVQVSSAVVGTGSGFPGGQQYAIGDLLEVSGGTVTPGGVATILRVTSLNFTTVTGLSMAVPGSYIVPPPVIYSSELVGVETTALTGNGSGAVVNLTYQTQTADDDTSSALLQVYDESDFLLLGIPAVLAQ